MLIGGGKGGGREGPGSGDFTELWNDSGNLGRGEGGAGGEGVELIGIKEN